MSFLQLLFQSEYVLQVTLKLVKERFYLTFIAQLKCRSKNKDCLERAVRRTKPFKPFI